MNIPNELKEVAQAIHDEGGEIFVVGGAVRDWLMGASPKDFDCEVFGLTIEALKRVLSQFGVVNEVGRQFAVVKTQIGGHDFDFSLPRRDNKSGVGHKGFSVEADPHMTIEEAAFRRDFTINAVSFNPLSGNIVDPFGGVDDIRNRVLRPVGDRFGEDPLRILRGFQFVSRFDLRWDNEIILWGGKLFHEFSHLSQERVKEEWLKWATKSVKPSQGLRFLVETGWISNFPELENMIGVPQDSEWHPEGDVFEHTLNVVDAMQHHINQNNVDDKTKQKWLFAALLHDVGKPLTTFFGPSVNDSTDRWRAPAHAQKGEAPARSFMSRLFNQPEQKRSDPLTEDVVCMVVNHMRHIGFPADSDRAVRRLTKAIPLGDLEAIVLADHNGRPFDPLTFEVPPIVEAIKASAERLNILNSPPNPILMGRHLIDIGMEPGPNFGKVLEAAFEAQLDGKFDTVEGGKQWVKHHTCIFSGRLVESSPSGKLRNHFSVNWR